MTTRRNVLATLAGAQWIRPADLLKAQPKTSTGTTRVKIDAEQIVSRVNPMIFGQFIEHLGRCIYGGIYEEGSPLSDAQGFRKDVLEAVRRLNPPVIDSALLLKNPVERISFAKTSGRTAAKSPRVGYLANSPGVTSLTRLSVHCAERIVATSNSHGLRCSKAQVASGYM